MINNKINIIVDLRTYHNRSMLCSWDSSGVLLYAKKYIIQTMPVNYLSTWYYSWLNHMHE